MSLLIPDFTPGALNLGDMSEFFIQDDSSEAPLKKRGRWTPAEDDLLRAAFAEFPKDWGQVAGRVPGRSNKQCRERWVSAMDPTLIKSPWTPQEDATLMSQYWLAGGSWAKVTRYLPGRSRNAVKNRFASLANRLSPLVKHMPRKAHTLPEESACAIAIDPQDANSGSMDWETTFPEPQYEDNDEITDSEGCASYP